MKLLMIVCTALVLASCGNGKSGINKDTKADFQMDGKKMHELSMAENADASKPYVGKILEMNGYITDAQKAVTSASPNKFSFDLCDAATEEGSNYTVCYSDQDQTANKGKQVTIKGKFDGITVNDCVVY